MSAWIRLNAFHWSLTRSQRLMLPLGAGKRGEELGLSLSPSKLLKHQGCSLSNWTTGVKDESEREREKQRF